MNLSAYFEPGAGFPTLEDAAAVAGECNRGDGDGEWFGTSATPADACSDCGAPLAGPFAVAWSDVSSSTALHCVPCALAYYARHLARAVSRVRPLAPANRSRPARWYAEKTGPGRACALCGATLPENGACIAAYDASGCTDRLCLTCAAIETDCGASGFRVAVECPACEAPHEGQRAGEVFTAGQLAAASSTCARCGWPAFDSEGGAK